MSSKPSLTVIVCTYNRAGILADCLDSLARQHAATSVFRVLVVDNNSSDHTRDVVRQYQENDPPFSYHFEPHQGLSHARNAGLRVADTDWCAFLDDDAMAHRDWVERILDTIRSTDFDAFGGVYLPWYRDGKVDWYLDEYATNATRLPYRQRVELEHDCFSGGNAVFRRDAAIRAGGFPVHLGMHGTTLGYGEETALQHRMRELGFTIGFDPLLLIDHLVPLHKQTLGWFRERSMAEGRSHFARSKAAARSGSPLRLALDYLWQDLAATARAARRLLGGQYGLHNAYIDVVPRLLFQREVLRALIRIRRGQPTASD
jgi:glycosyltransferase involved in cell wall biosynthesis